MSTGISGSKHFFKASSMTFCSREFGEEGEGDEDEDCLDGASEDRASRSAVAAPAAAVLPLPLPSEKSFSSPTLFSYSVFATSCEFFSADSSVCHASVAHLTRAGNSRTPEKT